MPYYAGDYYTGDYYSGDPFLGGLFGAIRGAVGIGRKVITAVRAGRGAPGPVGIMGGTMGGSAAAAGIASRGGALARAGMQRAGRMVMKHPVLTAAGAAGTIGVLGGRAVAPGVPELGAAPMRGFHFSERLGRWVRNRRMRVTNPRALRRAIRRATGFARLAKRVLRFTSPRAPRGRAVFKFKRRRK